jgi:Leucine-rich repeat (LRR) protein
MQYRIDHLENLKADAMDLVVHPPLKIIGEVEEFVWQPEAEIHIDENGDVQEVAKNLNAIITSDNQIQLLEDKMELYAGAPREAMGVRSPGEKTAFEVQQLQNAAGRIFQEKMTTFEVDLLEPALNAGLETAMRNMNSKDIIRVIDSETDLEIFQTITKDDITASGKLRPIGARHFSEQARLIQDLANLANTNILALVQPHISTKNLSKVLSGAMNVEALGIFEPNVAITEQMEMQRLQREAEITLAEEEDALAGGVDENNLE